MNTKFFLAVLASSATAFFGGWLIFGVTFTDYYESNTNEAAKILMKYPVQMWAVAIGNIAWSLLLTYVLYKNGSNTFLKGLITSLWISFLIMLVFDLSMFAFWNIYTLDFLIADIFISSLYWSVVGGVAGSVLGTGNNKTTVTLA